LHQQDETPPTSPTRRIRHLLIRPSISRGRGYAVLKISEEIDQTNTIIYEPAPRTANLARIGRFNAFPVSSSINVIPDNIMLKIFTYITNATDMLKCGSVCKRWNNMVRSCFNKLAIVPAIHRPLPRLTKRLESAKVKIFGKSKTPGIETSSQKKKDDEFREVSIKIDDVGIENERLLAYLGRLAEFLTLKQACLLVDIDLNDRLLSFIVNVWEPRLVELRFLRCSFDRVSSVGMAALLNMEKLRRFSIDNCPMSPNNPLADSPTLTQLCKKINRLELCFYEQGVEISEFINDTFLESISVDWKIKTDMRWLKLSNAPSVTTAGVATLIAKYFKLKWPRKSDNEEKHSGLLKSPNFVLWLCNTSFDVDEFLKNPPGRRWFKESPVHSLTKRNLRDSYNGDDIVIWVEKKSDDQISSTSSASDFSSASQEG